MRSTRTHKGGKRPAAYVAEALRTIQESAHPLSTLNLIQKLGLSTVQETPMLLSAPPFEQELPRVSPPPKVLLTM